MASVSVLKWFRDISIAKKLYFAIGLMAVLIAVELFTLWFSIHTLSSLRAFITGEGLWSKSEKDAVYYLRKYAHDHQERDYQLFLDFMKVPLGDHKTRMELLKPSPDLDIARQGFIEGRNDSADVDGMIQLVLRFHNIYYLNKALIIWGQGDVMIGPLITIGQQLHNEITSPSPSPEKISQLIQQLETTNEKLTVLEDNFSYTLGEGSRWMEHLVLKILFSVALTVEITGLLLTISVSRGIQKGLNEIIRASKAIAKGDFKIHARTFSGDEIGVLANSFNQMAEELGKSIDDRKRTSEAVKKYAQKLEQSNNSLEQFAYVASHDLQEPLRTITNFAGLLQEKQKDNPDLVTRRYLSHIIQAANRMKVLIRDLLLFSRLDKNPTDEDVNCEQVVKDVLTDMSALIRENNAKITTSYLPVIKSSKTEVHQIFQNLIGNAIKYRKEDADPEVEIIATRQTNNGWTFSVKDNGIGIEDEYKEKIFVIFQRLHNQKEYSGTGIGLATCKKIVELNGGKIWVESNPPYGSIFYFTLPKA